MRALSEYVKLYEDSIQEKIVHREILELVIKKAMADAIEECSKINPVCHVIEGQCWWSKERIIEIKNEIQ